MRVCQHIMLSDNELGNLFTCAVALISLVSPIAMETTIVPDTSRWPEETNMSRWSRVLDVNVSTLHHYRRQGRLKVRKALKGQTIITKQAIMDCFKIKK
jgi:hypothetical protein